MEMLLRWLLSNALAATALAAIVAVAGLALGKRPALRHVLWLLVLLKLVTPPLATFPIPLPRLVETHATPPPESTSIPAPAFRPPVAEPVAEAVAIEPEPPASPIESNDIPQAAPPSVTVESPSWSSESVWAAIEAGTVPALLAAWLAGSALWLCVTIRRVGRFSTLLREASPAPTEAQECVDRLAARLGVKRPPVMLLVSGTISPMLWALGTAPRLIVPESLWSRLEDEQREALVLHELAHLKRRDHWVRFLELAVGTVYWWHPVAWWARRALREAEEQCCDAWVVWALPESPRSYATALVEAVEFLSEARGAVPLGASGLGQFRHLSRRIAMIMKGNASRSLSWIGLLAVLALAALLLPWMPGLAQQATPPATIAVDPASPGAPTNYIKRLVGLPGEETPRAISADDPDREEQLADARDEIELIEATLESKRAALAVAQSQLDQQHRVAARLQALHERGSLSNEEVEKARADVSSAEAQLVTRKAELREAEVKLRQAKRRLDRLQKPRVVRATPQPPTEPPWIPEAMMGAAAGGGSPTPFPIERLKTADKLKQIGLALHNFNDVNGGFPAAAITSKDGKPLLSWRVAILPYLGQQALYDQFHLNEPWDSDHNKALLSKMPDVYAPSKAATERHGITTFLAIVGPGAGLDGKRTLPFTEFTDGLSNTVIVAEAFGPTYWTKPEDSSFSNHVDPTGRVGPLEPSGDGKNFLALFADGSVHRFETMPPPNVLRALLTRNGGEIIAADQAGTQIPAPSAPRYAGMTKGAGRATPPATPATIPPGNDVAGSSAGYGAPAMGMPGTTPSRGSMAGGMSSMMGYGPPARDAEKRLSDLEAKMDRLLKELETLRKEGGKPTPPKDDPKPSPTPF